MAKSSQKKTVGVGFGVMIRRGDKILLGQRHFDARRADSELHGEGTWTMPGGKLHFREKLETGACREVFEETGLRIKPRQLKLISVTNDIVSDAHFVTLGLLCRHFLGQPKVKEPDEITRWQWFALNRLPKPLFFPSAEIIKHYLSKQIY